jgi:hypothetical protein
MGRSMNKKLLSVLLIIVLILSLVGLMPRTFAQLTTSFYPVADSYVDISKPDSNFGGSSYLAVWPIVERWRFGYISYLRFDLGVIPAGWTVVEAKLRLYLAWGLDETATIGVHYVPDNTWDEFKITWANKPSYDPSPAYVNDTIALGGTWYEWKITKEVSRSLGSGLSLALVGIRGGMASFYSKEGRYKPTLIVQYTVPDSTPPSIGDVKISPVQPTVEDEVTVTAKVTDAESGVKSVSLSYTDKGTTWKKVSMERVVGDSYMAVIPQQKSGLTIQYYIEVEDNALNKARSATLSYTVGKPSYYQELYNTYNELKSRYDLLTKNYQSLLINYTRLEEALKKTNEALDTTKADLERTKSSLDKTRSELDAARRELADKAESLSKAESELTAARSQLMLWQALSGAMFAGLLVMYKMKGRRK